MPFGFSQPKSAVFEASHDDGRFVTDDRKMGNVDLDMESELRIAAPAISFDLTGLQRRRLIENGDV
jgi:hypothetical protein